MKSNKVMRTRGLFLLALLCFAINLKAWKMPQEYQVRGKIVYFRNMPMQNVHIPTFKELGYGYAKDMFHVYCQGQVLQFVNPNGFNVALRYGDTYTNPNWGKFQSHVDGIDEPLYYKSNFDVFFNGKKIDGASASSFRELGDGYAKDSFNVYFMGRKMGSASSSSFKLLGDGYASDAFNSYYMGKKLEDASGNSSFRYDGNGYAHDSFNTYYFGKKIN